MTSVQFKHEEIAPVPRGYKVRTVRRGAHEIRIAVPPGPRRRGAGVLVEILHPAGENPSCRFANLVGERPKNPSSVYGMAVSLGYPYLRGEGRVSKDGRTWLNRVTKKTDGSGPAIFVGWDSILKKWVVERAAGKNPRRKNPEDELAAAEDLYEEFHGREPREILEMQESSEQRGDYTGLGDLIELTMIAPGGELVQIAFGDDGVRVASSPNGQQLYLLGGNQDISESLRLFGADESKDLVDLGEAKQIVYDASKWQTNFTAQDWKHDFGEESGVRPRGFYDQLKRRIFFAGGNYKVTRPGIVD